MKTFSFSQNDFCKHKYYSVSSLSVHKCIFSIVIKYHMKLFVTVLVWLNCLAFIFFVSLRIKFEATKISKCSKCDWPFFFLYLTGRGQRKSFEILVWLSVTNISSFETSFISLADTNLRAFPPSPIQSSTFKVCTTILQPSIRFCIQILQKKFFTNFYYASKYYSKMFNSPPLIITSLNHKMKISYLFLHK